MERETSGTVYACDCNNNPGIMIPTPITNDGLCVKCKYYAMSYTSEEYAILISDKRRYSKVKDV